MKIVIPDDAPAVLAPSAAYKKWAAETAVEYYDTLPGTEDGLLERVAAAGIVINIRSSSKFTARVLEGAPYLRLLSIWGTGTDNIDLEAARRLGITVTNTPGVAAPSIAEHCLALMLAVARRIPQVDAQVRGGAWPRAQSVQLRGKTLGVIGLGAIGREFARLAAALGLRVISWTMNPKPELGFAHVALDEIYRSSDVVSLHLRLSPETEKFLGRRELEMMKPSAILINTARGPMVDEAALIEALSTRRIAGAGLDVFETEPLPAGHPLTLLDNVVLTPHSAGVTPETLEAGLAMAIDNVRHYLAGQPTHVV